jgi:4,5-dihydroxyphthalate decarboxylase
MAHRDVEGKLMALSMSLIAGPLTKPLTDGSVKVPGFDVEPSIAKSVDANSRQMLKGEFDVAEMSLGTFLKGRDQSADVVGLPIFTGRRFLHGGVVASAKSDIQRPEDLRGKYIGLPQFWQTSSIWHRGILQREHDVPQDSVVWYTAADERFEGLVTPYGVDMRRLPEGASIDEALASGDLDAALMPSRNSAAVKDGLARQVHADPSGAEAAFYRSTGVFPIMHFITLRRSLAEQQPELPRALFSAFLEAKNTAEAAPPIAGLDDATTTDLFGPDPWAYGLEPNRLSLETFLDMAKAQTWIDLKPAPEELFVPTSMSF